MKTKLKTLNNIAMERNLRDLLKREAIKWVEEFNKEDLFIETSDFMDFFNISEEDLKGGVD